MFFVIFQVILGTHLGTVLSDPLLFSAPIIAAPAVRSALVAPALAAGVAPAALTAAAVAPTTFTSVVDPSAIAPVAANPYSSVSSYVYGSGYSTQDYLVSPSAALTYGAYSLPYAYAADWYYRR